MGTDVIVLNGGSSSGKSSMARCLQIVLPRPWLTLGVDTLIEAMPPELEGQGAGLTFDADGGVAVGPEFRRLEAAWYGGIGAMARAGVGVIVDDVFLGGGVSQDRLQSALEAVDVLWVAVHCDPTVATEREGRRSDRIPGMAASQAEIVHHGVRYDVEVDTTSASPMECARTVAAHVLP
jgi:chloramphenicol 3-O phosphotransferase